MALTPNDRGVADGVAQGGAGGAAQSWDAYLTDWERQIWPTFEKHGIGKDAAFLAWMARRIDNTLERATAGTVEENEEWKG